MYSPVSDEDQFTKGRVKQEKPEHWKQRNCYPVDPIRKKQLYQEQHHVNSGRYDRRWNGGRVRPDEGPRQRMWSTCRQLSEASRLTQNRQLHHPEVCHHREWNISYRQSAERSREYRGSKRSSSKSPQNRKHKRGYQESESSKTPRERRHSHHHSPESPRSPREYKRSHHRKSESSTTPCEDRHSRSQPVVLEEPREHRSKSGKKRKHKHHKHLSRSLSVDRPAEKEKKSHSKHRKRSCRHDSDQETTFIGELLKNSKIDKKESSLLLESVAKSKRKKIEVEEGEIQSDLDQKVSSEERGALTESESLTPPIHLLKTQSFTLPTLLLENKSFTPPIHLRKVTDHNQNEIVPAPLSVAPMKAELESQIVVAPILNEIEPDSKSSVVSIKEEIEPVVLTIAEPVREEIEPVAQTFAESTQKAIVLAPQSSVEPLQEIKTIEAAPPKKKSVLDLPMPPIDYNRPISSSNHKWSLIKAFSPVHTEIKLKARDEHYLEVCNHLKVNPIVISPQELCSDALKRPKVVRPRPSVIKRKSPLKELNERRFESFKMKQLIGEGTYGRVYKAKDLMTNELVALKYVRMEKEFEGFPITGLREIRILRELQHPNIVEFRELVYREGPEPTNIDTFLVFEYMNYDLMGLLDNPASNFDEDSIFLIFKQLLEGLKYCHMRRILHRDLKCSNILLNKAGEVKLADFGLGRQWIPERPYTNKVISLWYRPIELLLGEEKYGPPVDVWSLGCIFGELFQRRAVFPFGSELETINGIFQLCGTPTKHNWPEVKYLPGYATLHPSPMRRTLLNAYQNIIPPLALELFDEMLKLNPASRISAENALKSKWITSMSKRTDIKPLKLPDDDDCHELGAKMRRKKRSSSNNQEK